MGPCVFAKRPRTVRPPRLPGRCTTRPSDAPASMESGVLRGTWRVPRHGLRKAADKFRFKVRRHRGQDNMLPRTLLRHVVHALLASAPAATPDGRSLPKTIWVHPAPVCRMFTVGGYVSMSAICYPAYSVNRV